MGIFRQHKDGHAAPKRIPQSALPTSPPHPTKKENIHRKRDGRTARRRHTHRDFTSSHSRARLGPDFFCASPVPSVVRGSLV